MGCSCSIAKQDEAISKEIDNQLMKERNLAKDQFKLLLLGAGEGGKSTIVKQMKIIHGSGYSTAERMHYRPIVHLNTLESLCAILLAMEKLDIHFSNPHHKGHAKRFLAIINGGSNVIITTEIGQLMMFLWNNEAVQRCFSRSIQYQLNDSASYFLNDLPRISSPTYIPSERDVLKSRVRTTGINETSFYCKDMLFRMVDVGGQRSQRKKWLHCFEDVAGIIFCTSLSEYDMFLEEDCKMNRMVESMQLFDTIANNRWLSKKPLILFLNKTDLLRKKICCSPLTTCFPEYEGPNTYEGAVAHIQKAFMELRRRVPKEIYVHLTCAIDTQNIQWVFNIVSEMIIKMNQRECGLY